MSLWFQKYLGASKASIVFTMRNASCEPFLALRSPAARGDEDYDSKDDVPQSASARPIAEFPD